jgi:UDP-3-O-[3-hydroxymyristoyl] glucosamine N-acyltransferase
MSGVMADVPDGAHYVGIPATPDREQMLKQAAFSKLPELRQQVRNLEAALKRLEEQTGNRPSAAA